jgi:hypothetical protein
MTEERPLERLLDSKWDQNRSRGLKPCKLYDDYTQTTSTVWRDCGTHYICVLNVEQYMKMNEWLCAQLHFNVWKELGVKLANKHRYEYVPKFTQISREIKINILWNRQVQTDRTIPKKKPDVIIRNNENGTRKFIDVISEHRDVIKEQAKKVLHYKDLTI